MSAPLNDMGTGVRLEEYWIRFVVFVKSIDNQIRLKSVWCFGRGIDTQI